MWLSLFVFFLLLGTYLFLFWVFRAALGTEKQGLKQLNDCVSVLWLL